VIRLAVGYLCSEGDFGCYMSEDQELANALTAVGTPDPEGWQRASSAAWRWYGRTSLGTRVYVEVRNPDWSPQWGIHETPPPAGRAGATRTSSRAGRTRT